MKRKEIHELVEFPEHFIANINKVRVRRLQPFYELGLKISDRRLDELFHVFCIHVLHTNRRRLWRHLRSPVSAHICLHVFINVLVKGLDDSVRGLVHREGGRLPVKQLDLFAQMKEKIDVRGAHGCF